MSPGTEIRPEARLAGEISAVEAGGRMLWTITLAFPAEIGLVLLFKPVQPEAVLSFTSLAPLRMCAAGAAC